MSTPKNTPVKLTAKSSTKKKRENYGSVGDSKVVRELKDIYSRRLLPIERACLFSKFHNPEILDAEMAAKPTVLLVGQYSTGKTSLIRQLIGMDYPEIHIGPEPTTDKFVAVVHGEHAKTIQGNALTGVGDLPFAGLSTFGTGFLNKFAAAVTPSPLLKQLNIIDTPGVLSGEKQRTTRGYDFAKVCRWFAQRSDLILLMFDPSKLDISDELKSVIEELKPHEDKVRCVLNKANTLDIESLIRVYGALLWSMGKVFGGAEVSRVYVGSFQEGAEVKEELVSLFDKDKKELLDRLTELPKACAMRKVNDMVKRVRLATVNVCVLGHLRSQMPVLWGKEAMQEKLIADLPKVFEEVRRKYGLAEGDFPNIDEFRDVLRLSDFYSFPLTRRDVLVELQDILTVDIPRIVSAVHGITTWDPNGEDDDRFEENEGNNVSTPVTAEGTLKHVKLINLDNEQKTHSDGPLMLLMGVFLALLVALVAISAMDQHKTALDLIRSFSK